MITGLLIATSEEQHPSRQREASTTRQVGHQLELRLRAIKAAALPVSKNQALVSAVLPVLDPNATTTGYYTGPLASPERPTAGSWTREHHAGLTENHAHFIAGDPLPVRLRRSRTKGGGR
jgi:hypothetical protein